MLVRRRASLASTQEDAVTIDPGRRAYQLEKLIYSITTRVDEEMRSRLDEWIAQRTMRGLPPMSRSQAVRVILLDYLGDGAASARDG